MWDPSTHAGARPMATELKTTPPQQDTPTNRFKQCLRERLRLARELAALRARFAAVVDDYERVIRTMQALAPSLHVDAGTVAHPTSPEWGPSALDRVRRRTLPEARARGDRPDPAQAPLVPPGNLAAARIVNASSGGVGGRQCPRRNAGWSRGSRRR